MPIVPPPISYRNQIGKPENFFIHDGYEVRLENNAFDDTPFTDEFQLEVYRYARQVLEENSFVRVLDIGCGSGFKLITNFFDCDTVGIDVPATVKFLDKKWPLRKWGECGYFYEFKPELMICSDVIEHVVNPDELLARIVAYAPKRLIISTPERDQLCLGTHDGPPKNIHHVREWNFAEFDAYLRTRLEVKEHFVVNTCQIADCVISS